MDKAEYISIKNQLSFEKPLLVTALVIAFDIGLLALAIFLFQLESSLAYLASQILLAVFYFHNFAMLHEAGHGNIHKIRWVNDVFGHYFSLFCFMPYYSWKHMHQGHHVWAGSLNKDPSLRVIHKIINAGKIPAVFLIAWRHWIPLLAFLQHIFLWLYPFRILKENPSNRQAIKQSLFSVVFLACCYSALIYALGAAALISAVALSIYLYLVLTEVENLPHHEEMPRFYSSPERDKLHPWEQNITTRSCHYPGYLSELISLNFNLHTEHHFFPNLPWYRLKQARNLLKPALGAEYNEVDGVGWNIRNRSRDPHDLIFNPLSHPILQSSN